MNYIDYDNRRYWIDIDRFSLEEAEEKIKVLTEDAFLCLHRDDGPAIELINPYRDEKYGFWYQHGLNHRVGAPASILDDNFAWYYKGMKHCIDGPAVKWYSEPKYYLWNNRLTKKEYNEAIKYMKECGEVAAMLRYK